MTALSGMGTLRVWDGDKPIPTEDQLIPLGRTTFTGEASRARSSQG